MERAVSDALTATAVTNGAREDRLDRIARLLRCPVETFTDGAPAEGPTFEADELLRLWLAIPDANDRGKVLALARRLAQS